MKKERVVPKKNYLYLLIMIISVVFVTFLIFEINEKYQSRKLESSYLDGYVNKISLNEVNDILTEPSSEMFILVTKTNDEEVYNFEVELAKVIKKNDLRDNFIYIDFTDGDIAELNKMLGSNISSIPAIIYLRNGEFVKNIDSSISKLKVADFQQLLDEYEVK